MFYGLWYHVKVISKIKAWLQDTRPGQGYSTCCRLGNIP